MSDTTAQPTGKLAQRFTNDPHSTIGSMMKRGLTGDDVQSNPQPTSTNGIADDHTQQALQTLDEVLGEVEDSAQGALAQAMPQVVDQAATDFHSPPTATSTQKEAAESVTLDQVAIDAARGAQQVEAEPSPEIPPEVESYLQKVEDHKNTAPEEIVIADGSQTQPVNHQYPVEPVVVLPITENEEKTGAKKSSKFSIRWLVEWSRRLMKVFTGKVVYQAADEGTV